MSDEQDFNQIYQQYKLCCENRITREALLKWIEQMVYNVWKNDLPLINFDLRLDGVKFTPPSDEFFFRILNLEAARHIDAPTSIANSASSASRVAWQVLKQPLMSLNLMLEAGQALCRLPGSDLKMKSVFTNLAACYDDANVAREREDYEKHFIAILNLLLKMAYLPFDQNIIYDCSLCVILAYQHLEKRCKPKTVNVATLAALEHYVAPRLNDKLKGRLLYELTKIV